MTQPTGEGTVVCRSPYNYKEVTIFPGDKSNGASIPRVLWWLYPPFYPDYLTASFVHDVLCEKEKYALADQYFDELLKLGGVRDSTRKNLVRGVKTWHKVAYKNNQPRGWFKLYKKVFR
jgi:hypothetical protein